MQNKFPFTLFNNIEYTDTQEYEGDFSLSKYPKGRLTDPILEQPASNEKEFIAETFFNRIQYLLNFNLFFKAEPAEIEGIIEIYSAESWWFEVKKAAKLMQNPCVIIPHEVNRNWLYEWEHLMRFSAEKREGIPEDFAFEDEYSKAQQGRLKSTVEEISLPIYNIYEDENYTIVFDQADLNSLFIQRLDHTENADTILTLDFEPDEENPVQGQLIGQFGYGFDKQKVNKVLIKLSERYERVLTK